ncbi:MAG: PQQ-binding-like beta-propeller repeat protein [Verrucomicrobiales bacterium]|nr:PQQ-binding-like beta-propeller repeat protein [Verrucomicrobiales bacterium]
MKPTIRWFVLVGLLAGAGAQAGDWPVWGRNTTRNFFSPEQGVPTEFKPGKMKRGTEEVDPATTRNVKWVAKLGSQAYGNPTVAGGRVFVGTNNESPRDPQHKGDHGIVMCFDEKTGAFLWQFVVPKLGAGKVSDWEFLGICSSPAVDGNEVYLVTGRCEIVCLDVHGMANGNQGYQDEGQYVAGPGKEPLAIGPKDADILWIFDMREELGVFPHNITSSSVLVLEDRVIATTSNGQDWSHVNIPSPFAPTLVMVDKKTGALLGEEASGISSRLMHCNWSSPAYGVFKGQPTIVFGAGDGFCYGFDTKPVKGEDDIMELRELWRFDCVPAKYKTRDGEPIKYPSAEGPSEIIGTPVLYKNRVYVAIGQDPEHGEGVGNLSCIDATQSGDITTSGRVWAFDGIKRSISTVSIDPATGLLFTADYSGYVYCLDAETGKLHWRYDMLAHIWGSTLVADGKVFIGDEDGDFVILPATQEFDPEKDAPIAEVMFPSSIYSTPVIANGTVYVATQSHLYAIGD